MARIAAFGRVASTRTNSTLYNGGFEVTPAIITAATNTATRWIDGTAAGSTASRALGWATAPGAITAPAEAGFDTSIKRSGNASLKLSTLSAIGSVTAGTYQTLNVQQLQFLPLLPSTTYTLVGYIRTNNVITNGSFIDVREFNAAGSAGTTTSTAKLSGTDTSFRVVTSTFTTASTTRFGCIFLRLNVAGNTSDAWFDDITLVPSSLGRTVASGRVVA